ncbi:hypothetical protein M9Y10_007058 [Tritrichomonas musculus]|uniref:Right handed beta helix domain-containing protein n=1 Tax=Tritrichomonas musculus TaxID=1915356 RepID=A0ABR2J083_9EUKA
MLRCSAEYGGVAYIYSSQLSNTVEFVSCKFYYNVATVEEAEDDLCGGSAIFLSSKIGFVKRCTFRNNTVKLLNDYNTNSKSLLDEKHSFSIINCNFDISSDSKYALFYSAGIDGIKIELENCVFSGDLDDDAHFIDGRLLKKNSPKLAIKSCKFSSPSNKVFNSSPDNQFVSVNLKEQEFNYELLDTRKFYKFIKLTAPASICVIALFLITIFMVVWKMKNYSKNNQNEDETSL